MTEKDGKARGFRLFDPVAPVDPTAGVRASMLAQQRLQDELTKSLADIPIPPARMSADEQREWSEKQLEAARATNGQIRELVDLTVANVSLARESQNAAARTERFSKRIAWASLVISTVSLLAATLAIVLQAVELQQG